MINDTQWERLSHLEEVHSRNEAKLACLHQLIDQVPGLIFWKDLNSQFYGANACALRYLYDNDSIAAPDISLLVGHSADEFVDEPSADLIIKLSNDAVEAWGPIHSLEHFQLQNHHTYCAFGLTTPLFNKSGDPEGTLGVNWLLPNPQLLTG